MSAGDNTRDDRWRPGFASSERRVREELADVERQIFSREMSFVPAQSTSKFLLIALEPIRHPASAASSSVRMAA
jgi:hypothetical protein